MTRYLKEENKAALVAAYPLDQDGTWEIHGEYINLYSPVLDTVSGVYADVLAYAMTLNGFIINGFGGTIFKCPEVKRITAFQAQELTRLNSELRDAEEQQKSLLKRISILREKINQITYLK